MAGAKRKRQKIHSSTSMAPLGSSSFVLTADPDASKDDEERELESALFGKPFVRSADVPKTAVESNAVDSGEEQFRAGGELDHVLDEDLFVVDDFAEESVGGKSGSASRQQSPSENAIVPQTPREERSYSPKSILTADDSAPHISFPVHSSKRKAAWSDPSDVHISISLANDKRLRKLRDAPTEDVVNGTTYESKLRRKYEQINPVPEWAQNARNKLHKQPKRPRSSATSDDDEPAAELDDLLRDTSGILSRDGKRQALQSGSVAIERLRDANHAAPSEGSIASARFHPSPAVPVMMTASNDRRLRLFTIDGLTNPLLQTFHIPDLPDPSQSCTFHPSGKSILLTSSTRPYYYVCDLESSKATKSSRGLWMGVAGGEGAESRSIDVARFDPQEGKLLAIAGRRGYVHLVDWASGGVGSGQVVGSLKCHSPVKDIAWVPDGPQTRLMTLSQNAEVYIWDVGSRKCIARWKDEGNYGAQILKANVNGGYQAIGSSTGIVNVYGSHAKSSDMLQHATRTPLKSITNLTTSITSIAFDRSSQVMAISSRAKKDQLRLIHLGSMTTFANWPTSSTPLGTVTSVDFSPGSEYIAIGNTRGKVTLYHLRHFVSGY